jgi:hypothetical protein
MFDFKKKRLDPLLKEFVDRINGAMPVNSPDQALGLLNVKKDIGARLGKLAQGQRMRGTTIFLTTLAATGGLVAAAFLAPAAAIAAGGGAAVVLLGGSLMAQKCAMNRGEATRDRYVLSDKIDTEVALAMTRFSGSAAAPDVKAALGQAFTDASSKKEYDALAKHAAKFVPPQPKKVAVAAPAGK